MSYYQHRFYRDYHNSTSLKSYKVSIEQSDLYIASTINSKEIALDSLNQARQEIKTAIAVNPQFLSSFKPIKYNNAKPPVTWMVNAAKVCGVGPMAAVAGAVSRYVGEKLLNENKEVIVENGGDIFISTTKTRKILVYAGNSPVSMKIAIKIPVGTWGICTSAGKVGPSISFGCADAAIVISKDCALSDAGATQLGNYVKSENDIESAVKKIVDIPNVLGAMVIYNDKIAALGEIELTNP